VLRYRERGRRRPGLVRAILAGVGALTLVASIPLAVVLPEAGVPALLVALRLLAIEVDWAAKAYAWLDWRASQTRQWFSRQTRPIRVALLVFLLLVAAALVWLLLRAFA